MKTNTLFDRGELVMISYQESLGIIGGAGEGWKYDMAEYLGMGVGYGAKKLWKLFKVISNNIYSMRSNPVLLYQ